MRNDVVGIRQARLIPRAMTAAGGEVVQLWWEYVRLGGEATSIDVEAYLRHRLGLPPDQQELLAQAAHGMLVYTVTRRLPGPATVLPLGVGPEQRSHRGTPLRRVGS